MLVDGRRVYSFWIHRDGEKVGGRWRVPWPKTLLEFLDGTARFTVVVHETGEKVFDGEVSLGSADRPDRDPQPQRSAPEPGHVPGAGSSTFDSRSAEQVEPLLDAIDEVLAALRKAGIEAFLAYGTLLGAVREGKLIGHDSDADLGYVSHHIHPVDVIRESFRVQRTSSTWATGSPATRRSRSRWTSRRATAWSAASTSSAASSWRAAST